MDPRGVARHSQINQAIMIAYNNSFLVIVVVMLSLIPPILLFRLGASLGGRDPKRSRQI